MDMDNEPAGISVRAALLVGLLIILVAAAVSTFVPRSRSADWCPQRDCMTRSTFR